MPVVPQAALAGQGFEQQPVRFDPIGTLGDIARFKTVQLQQKEAELKLKDYERARQLADQRQQALQMAGDDPRKLLQVVTQYDGPEAAAKLQKAWSDAQKAALDASESQTKQYRTDADFAASMIAFAQGAPDPVAAYQRIRPALQSLVPQGAGLEIPEVQRPEEVQQVLGQLGQLATTVRERADAEDTARTFWVNGDHLAALATMFAVSDSPELWQQTQQQARFLGAPENMIASFGPFSTENVEKARQRQLTPNEQASAASRMADDERQWAQLAETIRNNNLAHQDRLRAIEQRRQAAAASNARLSAAGSAGRPPTVEQQKTAGFFERLTGAMENLDAVTDQIGKMGALSMAAQGSSWTPNFFKSEAYQLFEQASREFTEARLRKESGAAIPPSEFENDRKTYFPQPGDSQKVLEQKRQAREALAASFARQAGGALDEYYGADRAGQLRERYQMGQRQFGTVKMRAPNGDEMDVPAAMVDHYKRLGAVIIGGGRP